MCFSFSVEMGKPELRSLSNRFKPQAPAPLPLAAPPPRPRPSTAPPNRSRQVQLSSRECERSQSREASWKPHSQSKQAPHCKPGTCAHCPSSRPMGASYTTTPCNTSPSTCAKLASWPHYPPPRQIQPQVPPGWFHPPPQMHRPPITPTNFT